MIRVGQIFLNLLGIALGIWLAITLQVPSALRQEFDNCPALLEIDDLAPMTLRIDIKGSAHPELINKCLYLPLDQKGKIVIIDRGNEEKFLKELQHQSRIPSDTSTAIPIGSLLTPSHILTIKDEPQKIQATLSEIKTGVVTKKKMTQVSRFGSLMKNNFEVFFYTVVIILTLTIWILLTLPIHLLLNRIHNKRVEKKYFRQSLKQAQQFINEGKIFEAIRRLTEIASSNTTLIEKTKAKKILNDLTLYELPIRLSEEDARTLRPF